VAAVLGLLLGCFLFVLNAVAARYRRDTSLRRQQEAAVRVVQTPTTTITTQAALSGADTGAWLMSTGDYAGTRSSKLAQITAANVGSLRATCAYQVGELGNFQSIPVVAAGLLYITTAESTIALDATSCRPRWKHVWAPMGREVWLRNRGVAVKDGRVVRGMPDGYLVALDAATGAVLWARSAADTKGGGNVHHAAAYLRGPRSDRARRRRQRRARMDRRVPIDRWYSSVAPRRHAGGGARQFAAGERWDSMDTFYSRHGHSHTVRPHRESVACIRSE
jgi:hypothetical protein